jgi:hypothetical protein
MSELSFKVFERLEGLLLQFACSAVERRVTQTVRFLSSDSHSNVSARIVVVGLLTCLTPAIATGQERYEISSSTSCPTCSIELQHVVTLGSPTDSSGLTPFSRVVLDSRGRYYAAPVTDPGQIAVYDSAGRWIQTVGTFGPGPSEFGHIRSVVVGRGDTLHVFHDIRYSVVAPSYEVVRSPRFAASVGSSAILDDGILALTAWIPGDGRGQYPAHVMASDSLLLSFGADSPTANERYAQYAKFQEVTSGNDGSLWLTHANRYRIEQWDTSGQKLSIVDRDAWWFPSRSSGMPSPYLARFGAISVDKKGLLWVLISVPKLGLRPLNRDPLPQNERNAKPVDLYAVLEEWLRHGSSIVEVIDLNTGSLLVSHRDYDPLYRFAGPGFVHRQSFGLSGDLVAEISRISLRRD